jgi:glutamate-1-semialdehyde 2,1-aminomutase
MDVRVACASINLTVRTRDATLARVGATSEKLFVEACAVIPGGVNSPVRAWRAVGGNPVFIQRGRGAAVVDADGRSYVDLVGSWGPLVLGHAHPAVVQAVADRARGGTSFGAPTPGEIELARLLVGAVPSLDEVRLVSSGTEATMSALRLARAVTGRDAIVKFDGCYHGHVDALLVRAGSGALTFGVPDSPGVPAALAALTLGAQYNDVEGVRALLRSRGGEIAAVIVEPVAGNMGVVPPAPGFLETLREETSRCGALLIFDEVITGFRVGWTGAQGRYGVSPDLTCLGKAIGGGMPLAAFGGRRAIMERLAPVGPVYQAGTLSGNPISVAAGLATLGTLRDTRGAYERLEQLAGMLEEALRGALAGAGVRACINRVGSMLTVFFGVDRVRSFAEATAADTARFARFFQGMLAEGVYLPPSQFEAMFVSLAHTEADVDRIGAAARSALAAG